MNIDPAQSAPPVLPARGFRGRVLDLHLALVFLTRLPLPHLPPACPPLSRSLWAFPLVGALIGGIAGAVLAGAEALGFPPMLTAIAALAVMALLTGALHEDGLADVADGFGGGGTPARKMEILRDSRIGSYGVIALILLYAVRITVLTDFPTSGVAVAALIGAQALGRAMIPLAMTLSVPARTDGLGASAGRPALAQLFFAVIFGGLILCAVISAVSVQTGRFNPSEVIALIAPIVTTVVVVLLARRHIGGYTGDVLGTVAVMAEVSILLTLLVSG